MNPLAPLAAQVKKAKLRLNPLLDTSFDCGSIVEARNAYQLNWVDELAGITATSGGEGQFPSFTKVRGTKVSAGAALDLLRLKLPASARLRFALDRHTEVKLDFGSVTTKRVGLIHASEFTITQLAQRPTLAAYLTAPRHHLVVAEVWVASLALNFHVKSQAGFDLGAELAELLTLDVGGTFSVLANSTLVSDGPTLLAVETARWDKGAKRYVTTS